MSKGIFSTLDDPFSNSQCPLYASVIIGRNRLQVIRAVSLLESRKQVEIALEKG